MKIKMFMLGVTAAVVLAACGEGAVMESSKAEETTTAAAAKQCRDGSGKQCGREFRIGEQHCRGNDSGSFAGHHRSSDRPQ